MARALQELHTSRVITGAHRDHEKLCMRPSRRWHRDHVPLLAARGPGPLRDDGQGNGQASTGKHRPWNLQRLCVVPMIAPKLTTRHVLRIFREATPDQLAEGQSWYAAAWQHAVRLDPANPHRAAGILAALSPRLGWAHNVERAERVYRDGYASGVLFANGRKADRIHAGELPLDVLGGDKVRAFYACIVAAGEGQDTDTVCVDRHAHDVVVGRVTDDKVRTVALSRKGGYQALAAIYVRAAKQLTRETGQHVSPSTVQAVTWTVWRASYSDEHGRRTATHVTGRYFGVHAARVARTAVEDQVWTIRDQKIHEATVAKHRREGTSFTPDPEAVAAGW